MTNASAREQTSNIVPPTISAHWSEAGPKSKFTTEIDRGFGSLPVEFAAPEKPSEITYLAKRALEVAEGTRFLPAAFDALDGADRHNAVRELAKAGNELFKAVINHDEGHQGDFLQLLGSGDQQWLALVKFPATKMPWELMYVEDVPLVGAVELGGFLGARYLLSKAAPARGPASAIRGAAADRAADPMSAVKELPGPHLMTIGHIWDDELTMFRDTPANEHWYARLYPELGRDELAVLNPDVAQRDAMKKEIVTFLQQPNDSVHFDCDGTARDDDAPERLCIHVRKQYRIEYADVKLWSFGTNVEALAFLNICSSDRASLGNSPPVAELLHSRGARSVIATGAKVSQALAARVAEAVYGRLLKGEGVGKALFESRLQLIAGGNPAALLWTLYGSPIQTYVTMPADVAGQGTADGEAVAPAGAA